MPLPGPLKNILRGGRSEPSGLPMAGGGASSAMPSGGSRNGAESSTRPSRGLEEFFSSIRGRTGLTILDLGGVSQQNVSFITSLGHRLYSEDFLRTLTETFGPEDAATQANVGQVDQFLRNALSYPDAHFDAVLVWDALEYLSPVLLPAVVDRLFSVVKPRSYMLAFFHSDEKLQVVPRYTFRIQDIRSLQLEQQGARRPAQLFNNRSLEKLFSRYDSVKFFLTRERLREVIIKA
jgi:hypothetical protein